jgi:hypothetical protein
MIINWALSTYNSKKIQTEFAEFGLMHKAATVEE